MKGISNADDLQSTLQQSTHESVKITRSEKIIAETKVPVVLVISSWRLGPLFASHNKGGKHLITT